VLNERQKTHGSFSSHSAIAQDLKEAMYAAPNWKKLPAYMKESLEMITHKIARVLNGDPTHVDHWVDIAGYSTLVGDRLAGKEA
jgi:hypothetical protein